VGYQYDACGKEVLFDENAYGVKMNTITWNPPPAVGERA